MKKVVMFVSIFVLLASLSSSGQDQVTRIVLINSNIATGAIFKDISLHCRNVVLTIDASKANFELEAQINKESERGNERSWLTLFNKEGDAVFTTDTHGTGNAIKDVCNYLKLGNH